MTHANIVQVMEILAATPVKLASLSADFTLEEQRQPLILDIHPERQWGNLLHYEQFEFADLLAYFNFRRKVLKLKPDSGRSILKANIRRFLE